MSKQYYEPFGEPLSQSVAPMAARDDEGSSAMRHAGVTLFWVLVFTILTARAFFLDADIEKAFVIAKTYLGSVLTFFS